MYSTSEPARLAGESKFWTYCDRVPRKEVTASSGARSRDGCATISQEDQGVGTDPIFIASDDSTPYLYKPLTKRTSPVSTKGLVVNHSHMKALVEWSLTESIRPRRSLFTSTAMSKYMRAVWTSFTTLEFQLICGPALLLGHDICHCTATADHS